MNTKNIRSKVAIAATSLLLFGALPLAAMAAVPYVSSTSPFSVSAGGSAFTLNVYGSNFDSSSVIYFNGFARSTGYVSPVQVWTTISASDIASPGVYNINVVNTGFNGGTSNTLMLTVYGVTVNNPVPILSSISPSSAVAGSGSFVLTLYGSNFIPSSWVKFNGLLRATTYISANQLRAVIPSSDIATAVSDAVSVVNPIPGGGESNVLLFTVRPVSTTPGLPDTGFGPTNDPTPTENNVGLVAVSIASIAILSVAVVAGKKLWLVKR